MTGIIVWIAPAATMIAAMMTAANLGARLTGWGFVVFTIGALAWIGVGLSSGQTSLIVANGFLAAVDVIGIWRWLGREGAYEDGGQSAKDASRRAAVPSLFTASGIKGMKACDAAGRDLGQGVEALIECATGRVSYVVIASGGVDETLRAVPLDRVEWHSDRVILRMEQAEFAALAPLTKGDWPAGA